MRSTLQFIRSTSFAISAKFKKKGGIYDTLGNFKPYSCNLCTEFLWLLYTVSEVLLYTVLELTVCNYYVVWLCNRLSTLRICPANLSTICRRKQRLYSPYSVATICTLQPQNLANTLTTKFCYYIYRSRQWPCNPSLI